MKNPVWIFDLDNTLHNATPHIFPHINRSMTAYLQRHLVMNEQAASELRVDYWHRYGATLSGMMKHHDTDPDHFLWHTHQFPDLKRMVKSEPQLRHVLRKLHGMKLLFSNAPQSYARDILKILRIDDLFEDVFAIENAGYCPKPQLKGFIRLLRKHHLNPARCVMVEDSAENLHAAKRLGMRTVWINRDLRYPAFVDIKIHRVTDLPRALSRLVK